MKPFGSRSAVGLACLALALSACGSDDQSAAPAAQEPQLPWALQPLPPGPPLPPLVSFVPLLNRTNNADLGFVCGYVDSERTGSLDPVRRGGVATFNNVDQSYLVEFDDIRRRFTQDQRFDFFDRLPENQPEIVLESRAKEDAVKAAYEAISSENDMKSTLEFSRAMYSSLNDTLRDPISEIEFLTLSERSSGVMVGEFDQLDRTLSCVYGREEGPPQGETDEPISFSQFSVRGGSSSVNNPVSVFFLSAGEWSLTYDRASDELAFSVTLGLFQSASTTGSSFTPPTFRFLPRIGATGRAQVDPQTGRFEGTLEVTESSATIDLESGAFNGTFLGGRAGGLGLRFVLVENTATAGSSARIWRGLAAAREARE